MIKISPVRNCVRCFLFFKMVGKNPRLKWKIRGKHIESWSTVTGFTLYNGDPNAFLAKPNRLQCPTHLFNKMEPHADIFRIFATFLCVFTYMATRVCVCVCFNETQLQNISFVFKFQSKRKSVQFSNAFVLSGQRYMALYCRIAFEL